MSLHNLRYVMLAACAMAVTLFAADSPFAGTWKINTAKSKLEGSGMGPATVRNEVNGNTYKASVDGTDPKGQPTKFSYEGSMDAKEMPVTGSPSFDTISIKRVNDHTLTAIGKKDGKVVFKDRRVVSSDGKTITLTRNGTSPEGKKFHATAILEKQ